MISIWRTDAYAMVLIDFIVGNDTDSILDLKKFLEERLVWTENDVVLNGNIDYVVNTRCIFL